MFLVQCPAEKQVEDKLKRPSDDFEDGADYKADDTKGSAEYETDGFEEQDK